VNFGRRSATSGSPTMSTSSRAFERALLELLWSHWTEIGVSGWQLQPSVRAVDVAVDPEPLIILTAALASAEPRLRDEATDWCVAFGRYVSKVRLKNLLKLPFGETSGYADFAATANRAAHLGWPQQGGHARPFKATGRSRLVIRGRPSAIRLRARIVFGVSARAEILALLGGEQRWSYTAAELAERARYGRRGIVEALDALVLAGLVRQVEAPTARRYTLADPTAVHGLLGAAPSHDIDWGIAFDSCWNALSTLRSFGDASATIRAIEAAKAAERISEQLIRTWLVPPGPVPSGENAWERFESWSMELVRLLEDPGRVELAPRRARPRATRRAG
jgi:hypothetical protein